MLCRTSKEVTQKLLAFQRFEGPEELYFKNYLQSMVWYARNPRPGLLILVG